MRDEMFTLSGTGREYRMFAEIDHGGSLMGLFTEGPTDYDEGVEVTFSTSDYEDAPFFDGKPTRLISDICIEYRDVAEMPYNWLLL
jgi:hypothetical protein